MNRGGAPTTMRRMIVRPRHVLALGMASLGPIAASPARGDALPPATPISCPGGSHVRHDHGGTRCEADAPKDCPAGWRGIPGGQCVLAICQEGSSCPAGQQCVEVGLCSYTTTRALYGAVRGPELAGPPAIRKVRVATEACGAARSCAHPAKCRPGAVCLPAGVTSAAPKPTNAGDVVLGGAPEDEPEDELPPSEDPPAPPATGSPPTPEPRTPGKSGGCAGCAQGRTRGEAGSLLALGLGLAAWLRRRRP